MYAKKMIEQQRELEPESLFKLFELKRFEKRIIRKIDRSNKRDGTVN